jgi:hypothetical protein
MGSNLWGWGTHSENVKFIAIFTLSLILIFGILFIASIKTDNSNLSIAFGIVFIMLIYYFISKLRELEKRDFLRTFEYIFNPIFLLFFGFVSWIGGLILTGVFSAIIGVIFISENFMEFIFSIIIYLMLCFFFSG